MTSTTHAGGIQPSASFFRPSRPYSRPGSPSSIIDISHDDLEHEFVSLKRIKQSREPLLPGPGPLSAPPPLTPSSSKNLVRTSLDRVIRGFSFDSAPNKRFSTAESLATVPPLPTSPSPIPSQSHESSPSSPSSSPEPPLFNPTPPPSSPSHPPLRFTPILDERTKRPILKYTAHPSRNRFFLQGRLLTGGDTPYAFLASFTLLLGICGCYFSTTAVWWFRHISPAVPIIVAYLALVTISTMLSTALTDPGILPRDLDPDPPYPATSPSDGGIRAPMPRDLKVRSDVVRVKYCPTCKTYRPPRSSHCKMCDNCVDGCDHHCQWVNNCIGRRNYTTFFALLMSATLSMVIIIITSALHLYFLTTSSYGSEALSFKHALGSNEGIGSAVAFILSLNILFPVSALLSYHIRLLLLNTTTIEQIRNQAHKSLRSSLTAGVGGEKITNPFSHGSWSRNIGAVLCRPRGRSWLDARGVRCEDKREIFGEEERV